MDDAIGEMLLVSADLSSSRTDLNFSQLPIQSATPVPCDRMRRIGSIPQRSSGTHRRSALVDVFASIRFSSSHWYHAITERKVSRFDVKSLRSTTEVRRTRLNQCPWSRQFAPSILTTSTSDASQVVGRSSFRAPSTLSRVPRTLSQSDHVILRNCQLQQRLLKRFEIARELIESERRYVDNLTMIRFNFVVPLVESLKSAQPVTSTFKISTIFSNLNDILHVSSTLLTKLQDHLNSDVIGMIDWNIASGVIDHTFTCFGHYFKAYNIYCCNFKAAMQTLDNEIRSNRRFRAFLVSRPRKDLLRGMSLHSYLLMPVQRVPRYRMLLIEMLKHTSSKFPDHHNLIRALRVVEEVATGINDSIERQEYRQELHKLEKCFLKLDEPLSKDPSRKLLKRGPIVRIGSKCHQKYELFLFSDCLILGRPVVPCNVLDVSMEYYLFAGRLSLTQIIVVSRTEYADDPNTEDHKCFWQILSNKESFVVYCYSASTREKWLSEIEHAKSRHIEAMSSIKGTNTSPTISRLYGRQVVRVSRYLLTALGICMYRIHAQYPIFSNYSAPIWIENSSAPNCQQCDVPFTMFRGRHHCRVCGGVICAACSNNRFMIDSSSSLFRACDSCYKSSIPPQTPNSFPTSQNNRLIVSVHNPVKPHISLSTMLHSVHQARALRRERKSLLLIRAAVPSSVRLSCTQENATGCFVT